MGAEARARLLPQEATSGRQYYQDGQHHCQGVSSIRPYSGPVDWSKNLKIFCSLTGTRVPKD
jgi:hypothetical protein